MKIRRFFGKDMREALRLVKDELGSDAVIMSNRKVADGIELVAAYDKEPKPNLAPKTTAVDKKNSDKLPSLSEIIGDDGPDSLRELLEKQAQKNAAPAAASQSSKPQQAATAPTMAAEPAPARTAQPAPAAQTSTTNNHDLSDIRAELNSLRNVLQFQLGDLMSAQQERQRPLQRYLCAQLEGLGISSTLARQLVSFTPKDCDERQGWLYLLKLLANRLPIGGNDILRHQGVVALVGPTGTGKTTTVAKLAARYAQKYGVDQVAMVTIDTYRIGAFEQLATYGKILGCTVRKAQSAEELNEQLFQLRHKRLVLIDTAGFSQRDSRLISQLRQFNENGSQPVRKYLVAQATTQPSALDKIIDAYQHVSLDGCIFTKLDECYSLGEVLSCAIERQLMVSYVTDGQQVPEDIKAADAKSLVSIAAKLYKKYGLNHTNGNQEVNAARAV